GTNVLYAAILQFGGRTNPKVIEPKRKKALFWPGAAHPVKRVNHPGSVIPARPFLGIGPEDEADIMEILTRHLGLEK
ncbi:MAG: phage virion morphogenesis protein, partial [Thermodesulfobacteriota bacterium]